MKIEQIITKLSTKIGKSETYIKGQLTQEKNKLHAKFGDALSEDRISDLAINTLMGKFGLDKSEMTEPEIVTETIDPEVEEIMADFDADLVEEEETTTTMTPNKNAWRDFIDSIPEPTYDMTTSKFERTPSLIVEIGPTYRLKMADLNIIPNPQSFEGKYGPYQKTPFKVILLGVSDSMLYDQVYSKGEFKGKKAFVEGQKYTLWMDNNCKRSWKNFFLKLTEDGIPDDREFTFRWTKKGNKNQWHFGLPK